MQDGPAYKIVFKANVVTPNVTVSTEKLDFGRIIVGHRKVMTVQLQNVITLPLEWNAGNPMHKGSKEASAFNVSPWQGWLEPGERVNIHISFTPNEERKWSYGIPIKVMRNPHTQLVLCKGEGAIYNLHFDPLPVRIGPILPFCTDGAITYVVNDTDLPAEVSDGVRTVYIY